MRGYLWANHKAMKLRFDLVRHKANTFYNPTLIDLAALSASRRAAISSLLVAPGWVENPNPSNWRKNWHD